MNNPILDQVSKIVNNGAEAPVETKAPEEIKAPVVETEEEEPEDENVENVEETAPVTTDEQKAPEAPVIDYDTVTTELSKGKYKSRVELETALAELDEAGDWRTQLEELRSQVPTDPEVLSLAAFKAAGGTKKQFDVISGYDAEKATDLEKIKLSYLLKNPTANAAGLDAYLAEKYRLDEEGGYTDSQIASAQFALQNDAAQAGIDLAQLQDGIKNIKAPVREDHAPKWESEVKSVSKVEKLSFGKDDTAFDVPVTDAERAAVENYLAKTVKTVPFNDKNKGLLKEMATNYLQVKKLPEIIEKAIAKGRSVAELKNIKETNNPSALQANKPNTTKKAVVSDEKRVLDYLKSKALN